MGSFDFFALDLTCVDCGRFHKANEAINMQTKIQNDMYLMMLGVGTQLDIYHPVVDCGYLEVNRPDDPNTFTLIETWSCSTCRGYQWAHITVEDSVITEGHAVALNKETIESVNYLSNDANDIGWQVEGGRVFREDEGNH